MSILDTTINTINLAEQSPEYVNYDPELKDKYGECVLF